MDPLSVAASVVGLLAAGGKVTALLFAIITSCKDSPDLARSIMWEVADISAALGHLQDFVGGRKAATSERGSLILLDQLLTTLTGCVTTYSDLQSMLKGLSISEDTGTFDRIKWMRQEGKLSSLVQRLQNHKSCLTLMLTIIQCKSMEEAQSSTQKLCILVEQVLESNQDLAERIRGLEQEGSIISRARSEIGVRDDASTIRQASAGNKRLLQAGDTSVKHFAFEDDLALSRAYNKAVYRHSQLSLTSTTLYTTALSVFSKLSLSQISSISFYALPVCAVELTNSELYVFGEEGAILLDPIPTPVDEPEASTVQARRSFIGAIRSRRPASAGGPKTATKGSGLLGRFATPQRRILPSAPENPIHVTHVAFDHEKGVFKNKGLPREWKELMNRSSAIVSDTNHLDGVSKAETTPKLDSAEDESQIATSLRVNKDIQAETFYREDERASDTTEPSQSQKLWALVPKHGGNPASLPPDGTNNDGHKGNE
ncbi:hypothetical protein AK830_g1594 [Neonectria ditissima]|uniref:CRIB domain-containing protein n=1 Tax=Neonectria ditissima TaxID=78410 RepID=A0A0P7BYJ2_9HYPO|nr:hypothetical protein AK830_g1594 [Neonectria ditissima]